MAGRGKHCMAELQLSCCCWRLEEQVVSAVWRALGVQMGHAGAYRVNQEVMWT